MTTSLNAHVIKTRDAMDKRARPFVDHWRDLRDYLLPHSGLFFDENAEDSGGKRHGKILNGTGTYAQRALSSGMMSGLTSPGRPWFRLITRDPEMRDWLPAREWLDIVTRQLQVAFQRSNLYQVLPLVYQELGIFGPSPFSVVPDPQRIIHCEHYTIGSYRMALDDKGRMNTFFRRIPMTVGQAVQKFGIKGRNGQSEGVSQRVANDYDKGNYYREFKVYHLIEPRRNDERNLNSIKVTDKPFRSVYVEDGSNDEDVLRNSGFDRMPVKTPRWQAYSYQIYGISPGMEALADVKQLQIQERRRNEGVAKMMNPPTAGPASLKTHGVSLIAGAVNYFEQEGQQKFEPVYQVDPRLDALAADTERIENRIKHGLYADAFLLLHNLGSTKGLAEVREAAVEELRSEKFVMLGPVLERMNDDGLDPTVIDAYNVLQQGGMLPPPPAEMEEEPIGVEYTSILAQAQRAIGVGNVERFFAFAGSMADIDPGALKVADAQDAVREYGHMVGVPAKMIRSEDEVLAILNEEKALAAQERQMAMAAEGAGAMRDMGAAVGPETVSGVLQGIGVPQ